ncbi:hypothetical protein [Pimelobacter simplex]|uniref:hypothetical protein n=1 Tax=Nocardioides simplex TaxID=2045 RepID=UPI003AB00E2C
MSDTTTPNYHAQAPPDWVPVERRFAGMDRRTLLPAGLVAALVALTFGVLPWLDSRIAVDDPTRAGDVIRVADVEFTPAAGWNIEKGLRAGGSSTGVYPEQASVTRDGVTFNVVTGAFTGTPAALLRQIRRSNDQLGPNAVAIASGTPTAIVTAQGRDGVVARFTTASAEGLIAAFVLDGTGVEVVAYGPLDLAGSERLDADLVAMIRSVRSAKGATS